MEKISVMFIIMYLLLIVLLGCHYSSLGVLAIIYVDFLIIYKYYDGTGSLNPNLPLPRQTKKPWTAVFLVVPVICFGYQVRLCLKSFSKEKKTLPL